MAHPPSLEAHLQLLARNNLWSNHRLLRACARLPEAEYLENRPAFFGSIHGTLLHILLADRRYLHRIEKKPAADIPHDIDDCPTLAALTEAQHSEDFRLMDFVDGLTADRLTEPVDRTDEEGRPFTDPLHVVLAHLFMHQVHHRGQVHDMLSQTGMAPPQLDEFFLSQDAPRRAQEMRDLNLA